MNVQRIRNTGRNRLRAITAKQDTESLQAVIRRLEIEKEHLRTTHPGYVNRAWSLDIVRMEELFGPRVHIPAVKRLFSLFKQKRIFRGRQLLAHGSLKHLLQSLPRKLAEDERLELEAVANVFEIFPKNND